MAIQRCLYRMKHLQHDIFPIKFNHNGTAFETKVLKHTYRRETFYKVAMPSAVSEVQQCWLSLNKVGEWNLTMGIVSPVLVQHLINVITAQEQVQSIYQENTADRKLKSA